MKRSKEGQPKAQFKKTMRDFQATVRKTKDNNRLPGKGQ
jgi:hypothetical protein